MKKIIVGVLLFGMLLSGCNAGTEQTTKTTEEAGQQAATNVNDTVGTENAPEPVLSLAEYPLVDGSTACLPLMAQVLADTCGMDLSKAQTMVNASKTAQSWRAIVNGSADLLLVYEAPESIKEEINASGVELEIHPIGRDALVFIANEANPVKNLSTQQLIDIYTGKITNWSKVGGEDKEILAFQRDDTSGSQTLFLKCLMKEQKPTEAPVQLKPGMMDELVQSIADYNNSANAIGYSVYYYISEMYSQPGLRLMDVDGITPSFDSISNRQYPFTNDFYVVIRKDEPADSPARILYQWILSENGAKALEKAGYVPAK